MGSTLGPAMHGPKSMGHSAMGSWGPHLWHGSLINGCGVMCYGSAHGWSHLVLVTLRARVKDGITHWPRWSAFGSGKWFFAGGFSRRKVWRVPNPPGTNPLVAERAPWRSSQSRVTGGQQPGGESLQIPVISSAHLATPVRPQ